jgi:hypothetical protein
MRRALRYVTPVVAVSLAACAEEGPTAYVSVNVPPDGECVTSPTSEVFLPRGTYDISPGADGACANPYVLNLVVNSNLRQNQRASTGRAEPNVLQLHSAEVRLMDVEKNTLELVRTAGGETTVLPNPFRVTTGNSLPPTQGTDSEPTRGLASLEAIPLDYAPFLEAYAGGQILAEVQVFGTTLGDVDVDVKPFVYPIRICDGCLTRCLGDIPVDVLPDVYGDLCADNVAADGRICVDPDC